MSYGDAKKKSSRKDKNALTNDRLLEYILESYFRSTKVRLIGKIESVERKGSRERSLRADNSTS